MHEILQLAAEDSSTGMSGVGILIVVVVAILLLGGSSKDK